MTTADAGQCVSFALKRVRRSAVRKGMVIVAKTETPPKGAFSSYVRLFFFYLFPSQQRATSSDKSSFSSKSRSYAILFNKIDVGQPQHDVTERLPGEFIFPDQR